MGSGLPDLSEIWVDFVLARTLRDLAGILDAVVGNRPGDMFMAPLPSRPYTAEISANGPAQGRSDAE